MASSSATAVATARQPAFQIPEQSAVSYFMQRVVESIIAASVLLVVSPVLLWVALIIKRGTPGPVLFRQFRMGKNERPFRFTKFRTLYADARDRWPELYAYTYTPREIEGLTFKIRNDPRVTPQGRWLRKSTIDELPNFWNVLTGHMALVGPRPEIPEMLAYYHGEQRLKFKVRPGITGLAQISGRGELSFNDTVRLDIEYVKNRSIWLDIKLIFLTLYKIAVRDGAF